MLFFLFLKVLDFCKRGGFNFQDVRELLPEIQAKREGSRSQEMLKGFLQLVLGTCDSSNLLLRHPHHDAFLA